MAVAVITIADAQTHAKLAVVGIGFSKILGLLPSFFEKYLILTNHKTYAIISQKEVQNDAFYRFLDKAYAGQPYYWYGFGNHWACDGVVV